MVRGSESRKRWKGAWESVETVEGGGVRRGDFGCARIRSRRRVFSQRLAHSTRTAEDRRATCNRRARSLYLEAISIDSCNSLSTPVQHPFVLLVSPASATLSSFQQQRPLLLFPPVAWSRCGGARRFGRHVGPHVWQRRAPYAPRRRQSLCGIVPQSNLSGPVRTRSGSSHLLASAPSPITPSSATSSLHLPLFP